MSWSQRWVSWVLQHCQKQCWAHCLDTTAEAPDTAAQKQSGSEGPLSGAKATVSCPCHLAPQPFSAKLILLSVSGRHAVTSSPGGLHRPHRCSHRPRPSACLIWASTWQRSEDSPQESLTLDTQPKSTEKASQGYCTDTDQCGKLGASKQQHGDGKLGLSMDWNKAAGPRARALEKSTVPFSHDIIGPKLWAVGLVEHRRDSILSWTQLAQSC